MTLTPPVTISYSPGYLHWTLGRRHPTNPERAKNAVKALVRLDQRDPNTIPGGVVIHEPTLGGGIEPGSALYSFLNRVHTPTYMSLIEQGRSHEWHGVNPHLGKIAYLLAQGTLDLVEKMVDSAFEPAVYFNPMGAKHHAHTAHSSGFCVFNDQAAAAHKLNYDHGLRVAILDWDAHHGDGTRNILTHNSDVLTVSIHDESIFPESGKRREYNREAQWIDLPVLAGSGDEILLRNVNVALMYIDQFKPDVLMVASGADGHADDPLSTLTYTHMGFALAAIKVGEFAQERQLPVLIGGAGGYRPHDATPKAWATVVSAMQRAMFPRT